MAKTLQEVSLKQLSRKIRDARAKKGWTLEQLSHELWECGHPTAQNKLWRLENKPPKRVDTELLLWMEKVLDVELLGGEDKKQVLIEDVVELIDEFLAAEKSKPPPVPSDQSLAVIHERLVKLAKRK